MAVENPGGGYLDVSEISADWEYTGTDSRRFTTVKFFPGAADDVLIVREASITGPRITKLISGDGEGRADKEMRGTSRPVIKYSECTLSAGHFVTFIQA